MYNDQVIGTCSLCGGPVTVPTFWWGTVPPTPTCERCSATQRQSYGPVIPMERRQPAWTLTWDRSQTSDRITLDDAHERYPLTFDRVLVRY